MPFLQSTIEGLYSKTSQAWNIIPNLWFYFQVDLSPKNDSVNYSNFMESEWTFEPSIGSRACTCGQKLWYRYLCPSIHSSPYNALCVFHVMGMHYDRVTVIGKTGGAHYLAKTMLENKTFFNSFFNGFHSSTLVQVIGNKPPGLGLFFSQIRLEFLWQNYLEKVRVLDWTLGSFQFWNFLVEWTYFCHNVD